MRVRPLLVSCSVANLTSAQPELILRRNAPIKDPRNPALTGRQRRRHALCGSILRVKRNWDRERHSGSVADPLGYALSHLARRKNLLPQKFRYLRGRTLAWLVTIALAPTPAFATTKGLSQIVTPDLQSEGDLSLSPQIQDQKIGNPYEIQAELGLTKWAEIAVFKGFRPNELIFGTELGLVRSEPYLLSTGFVNWSPHSHVDPQPFLEAGYYTEHHKIIAGFTHVDFRNEAILGYAYDFNRTWRVQVDWQSGSGNSSTIGFTCNLTRDLQFNPALYLTNDRPHQVLGYVVFTYTFHLWRGKDAGKEDTRTSK
jgi:hypothetical protein